MTTRRKGRRILARYSYRDEDGTLLYQVVRTKDPKGFFQRRPDGEDRWINDLKGVRRVLYQLPKVVAAVQESERVYIVEGEKDAKSLSRLKLVATTNSGGPGRWKEEHTKSLRGGDVAILPDNDDEGRDHAHKVAKALHGVAAEVRVVELPDLPEGGDISDWIATEKESGKSKQEIRASLEALVDEAPLWTQEPSEEVKATGAPARKDGDPTQATVLVQLAENGDVEFFHTPDQDAFAVLPVRGHREIWRIRSKAFKYWLLERYYTLTGEAPSSQSLNAAWNTLTARAMFEGEEHDVHLRLAECDGAIYLDLCNETWEAVEITATGWKVVPEPPVRFYRSPGMRPLPHPVRGGSIAELRPLVNLPHDDLFVLFVAFLVASLRPRGPYPLLVVQGEQGSTKSTLARMARALVDPSGAPLRTIPRSERDLMISASHSRILAFDNLSGLPHWLSDALCRLATGGGFATRELYTDSDEVIFSAMRPVILNGIDDIVDRQDLIDRGVHLDLPTIPDEERRREDELWAEFEALRPRLLGALLDAVSCALRRQSQVTIERPPRMADFAHWIVAAEPAIPWSEGTALAAYEANRAGVVLTPLDGDEVALAVRNLVAGIGEYEDTPTEVLECLSLYVDDEGRPGKDWPKTPQVLSSRLKRLAPALRRIGIEVEFSRDMNRRQIRIGKRGGEKARHERHARHKARNHGDRHDGNRAALTSHDATANESNATETGDDDADDADDARFSVTSTEPVTDEEEVVL